MGGAPGALDAARVRDAAIAADRARAGSTDPIDLWRGLVEGRWSVVDRFDVDGRRMLVAYRNDPPARRLTMRERQVAGYAALGRSNKMIAYELGLSLGTVAAYLAEALRKTGIRRRFDLAAAFGETCGA